MELPLILLNWKKKKYIYIYIYNQKHLIFIESHKSHKHTGNRLNKYNQIWHRIKANKNIAVNHNFTIYNLNLF